MVLKKDFFSAESSVAARAPLEEGAKAEADAREAAMMRAEVFMLIQIVGNTKDTNCEKKRKERKLFFRI